LHQWTNAIKAYTRVLESDPAQSEAYEGRAKAYEQIGEFQKANDDFIRAVELSGRDTNRLAEMYVKRALNSLLVQQPEKALVDFAKAHEINAKYLEAYHARGHAYAASNQIEKAIADFGEALQRASGATNVAKLHFDRALNYTRLGQHEKAASDYEKAIELNPKHAVAHNNLAWYYAVAPPPRRSPFKALPLALRAVELTGGTNANHLNTLAVAYYRAGELTNSIATFAKYIKPDGDGGGAFDFFFLAMAHQQLRNSAKAEAYYAKAVKWVDDQPSLSDESKSELDSFRAEADAVLGKK
jgi:tetratricopeptide (TPR) repeat protein